jgi:hypothetical protein
MVHDLVNYVLLLNLSIILIFNGVRRFGSRLFFRLHVKWEGAPNLVDLLERAMSVPAPVPDRPTI